MPDLARAQLLRLGRKSQMRVELALGEQLHGIGGRIGNDREVFLRVEPNPGGHQGDQLPAAGFPHPLPLQVRDGANGAMNKQLVTAAMHAGDDRNRRALVDADDVDERQSIVPRPSSIDIAGIGTST
jgi:hypothetical protein